MPVKINDPKSENCYQLPVRGKYLKILIQFAIDFKNAFWNNHFMIQFSEKHAEAEDWKLTTKKETSPVIQSDTIAPTSKPEETSINKG